MPELSGEERETARTVVAFLAPMRPDLIVEGLGGHGVAAVFDSGVSGSTVLLRSELDALPIQELSEVPHRSAIAGRGHQCGHDGHCATLALVARTLARERPKRGRVVLMCQPSEENGAGARAVVRDTRFAAIRPDISFSYHNMPGIAFGEVWLDEGLANCASRGMIVRLSGQTAHASQPENGRSPMAAVSALMPALTALRRGDVRTNGFAMATVTHARMGEPVFGVAPGYAEVYATLRTLDDAAMEVLVERSEALVRDIAAAQGLAEEVHYADVFAHVENAPAAVRHLRAALDAEGIVHGRGDLPFKGSEDFGVFGQVAPAAMFFLGAGVDHANLHTPEYDFPDALLPIAARVLLHATRQVVG